MGLHYIPVGVHECERKGGILATSLELGVCCLAWVEVYGMGVVLLRGSRVLR